MTHARGRLARLAAGIAAAVIGAGLVAVGAAPSASAADNGTWSVFPTQTPNSAPRTAFSFDLAAGATLKDAVTVKNQGKLPLTMNLYPADAFNAAGGGGFALRQQGEPNTGVGSWVTLAKSTVTIAPGKEVSVPFTMTVPRNASPGDHAGGIVAVNAQAEGVQESEGVTVGIKRAVGTRIYTRILGPLTPSLSITDVTVDTIEKAQIPFLQQGTATITYTVVNTGNTRISANQALVITGLFGQTIAQPALAKAPEILPGEQITLVQPWDSVPAFNQAHVRVEFQATDIGGQEVTAAGDATVWYVPWLLLLVIALVVVVIVVARRWRSRRTPEQPDAPRRSAPRARPSPRWRTAGSRRQLRQLRLHRLPGAPAEATGRTDPVAASQHGRGRPRRSLRGLLVMVAVVAASLGAGGTAYAQNASPSPTEPVQAQELVATPAIGRVGTETLVQLRGWPAGATVQVSTCGNNALNGNADCDNAGSISATTSSDGTFTGQATFSKPPKPCPCVLHAFSAQSSQVNNFPIELTGYPTAPPVADTGTRSLEITADVEGGGPLLSWFGGAAERELVLSLTNTGTLPLDNPPTTVSLGKGEDPTELLVLPRLGAIAPGETTEVRIPFELPAWSFGSYTVKTTVAGLDQPTAARATASTYPWFLLVIGWLLLQIPLLGLSKRRRPEAGDADDGDLIELDDPFRDLVPAATTAAALSAPVTASAVAVSTAGMPDWASTATGLAAAAVGAGAATAVLERPATSTPEVDASVPVWAAAAVAPAMPVTPSGDPSAVAAVAAALAVPAAVGVLASSSQAPAPYGVSHLRGFVDPHAAPGVPSAVAARVVVGGVVPRR